MRDTGRALPGFAQCLLVAALMTLPIRASAQNLGDLGFAKALCAAWNRSQLPQALGDTAISGSGWIDVKTVDTAAPGYQKIVSGRADCSGWQLFELVIEKQADGRALCTASGAFSGDKMTWKFVPSTANWFEFGASFGVGAFWDLWKHGMEGNKTTAWGNRKHFGEFFRLAAALAIDSDWRAGCQGVDTSAVEEALAELRDAD